MNLTLIALVSAVVIIGVVLYLIIHLSPSPKGLDKEKYQSRWLEIEHKLKPGDIDSHHMAILNADKLLDQALRESSTSGKTMGERMKAKQAVWSNANSVWAAHKLRNQIAHDENIQVSEETVRRALASFKKALKDLEAI